MLQSHGINSVKESRTICFFCFTSSLILQAELWVVTRCSVVVG